MIILFIEGFQHCFSNLGLFIDEEIICCIIKNAKCLATQNDTH